MTPPAPVRSTLRTGWTGPLRLLVVSAPGQGKTSLLLSMPKPFIFDFDFVLDKGVPSHLRGSDGEFMYVQPTTWQELQVLTMKLLRGDSFDGFKPETIGIDTLGGAYDIVSQVARSIPVPVLMGRGGKHLSVLDANTFQVSPEYRANMTQSDFGFCRSRITEWLHNLKRGWSGHLVVCVHEQLRDPAEGSVKPPLGAASLPGGLRDELPGLFDIYARLRRIGTNPPVMQTVPDELWPCKDRTGKLKPNHEATWNAISQAIYGQT